MSTRIVPIAPQLVPALTRLHGESFAGSERTALGPRYVAAFIDWFRRQPEAIGLAACVGAAPCGFVVGCPPQLLPSLYRVLLPLAAAGLLLRPWTLVARPVREMASARLAQVLCRTRDAGAQLSLTSPTMLLETICVADPWRRRGVGQALVRRFAAEAGARGIRSLLLTVLPDNTAARQLYERCGWSATGRGAGRRLYYSRALPDPKSGVHA